MGSSRKLLSAALVLLLLAPTTGYASPRTTPDTIVTEGFETTPSATYVTGPTVVPPANGNRFWGRISLNKRSGSWGLWCAGSTPPSTWPSQYTSKSSGTATFTVPQMADYYSGTLEFWYNMPSLGAADARSFGVHWAPTGALRPSYMTPFEKTSTTTPWRKVTVDLSSGDAPLSRRAGSVWFRWLDYIEGAGQSPATAVGPTVDDVVISGWKYGPARSVVATQVAHTTARITWSPPASAVGTTAAETRPVVYDVWRQTAGGPWMLLADGTDALEYSATGLQPGVGYTFSVQTRDSASLGFGQATSVTATATNASPLAVMDAYPVTEDVPLTVPAEAGVLANDTEPDGDSMTAARAVGPTHGTLFLSPDGSFTYTPNADYSGPDAFSYQARDAFGGSSTTTVTLTVSAVNDPPVARSDAGTVAEDETLTVVAPGLLGNDSDVEGAALTASVVGQPANGAVSVAGNGSYVYRPARDFAGTDSFTYRAWDGSAYSQPATVTITVSPINDAPVATGEAYAATEDVTLTVGSSAGVLANDADVDGPGLTAIMSAGPAHGTAVLAANGSFTYRPVADYAGPDSFTYRAYDGARYSGTVTVTLDVSAVNDAPVAGSDNATIGEDSTLTVGAPGLLANDSDIDGGALSAVIVAVPANGAATVSANGAFTYRASPDFNGVDQFTYRVYDGTSYSAPATVTITVTAVNDAPRAGADAFAVDEDTTLTVEAPGLLANDTDTEGSALTAVVAGQPANGTVTISSSGGFVYRPRQDFAGTDSFTYRASDGALFSAVATVTVTVRPVNDAPVAVGDEVGAQHSVLLVVPAAAGVLANDIDADNDPLIAELVAQAAHGTVVLAPDGGYTYLPDATFDQADSFTYRAFDGTGHSAIARVTIAAVDHVPTASADSFSTSEDTTLVVEAPGVLGNDGDEDGDALAAVLLSAPSLGTVQLMANGAFTYAAGRDRSGQDSFTYRAFDGASYSAPVSVSVSVAPVNDPPMPADDVFVVTEDGILVVSAALGVRANDFDVDSPSLTVTRVSGPSHGTLAGVGLLPDGSFSYAPNADYHGVDTITYRVTDGQGLSADAMVSITVEPVNDLPVAGPDAIALDEDGSVTVAAPGVLGNDDDVEGAPLIAALATGPADGTLLLSATGGYTYTPSRDHFGTDTFTYRAFDGEGYSAPATVTITVRPVNDVPVALPDTVLVAEDETLSVTPPGLLGTASDIDGDALQVTVVRRPGHGELYGPFADGSYSYRPAADFAGDDSFTYRVSDGTTESATATVAIIVTPRNDTPRPSADTWTTGQDETLPVAAPGVLGNDVDPDLGSTLSASVVSQPAHGTLALQPTGAFTYVPAAGYFGTDTFTYRADDGFASAVATVTLTVTRSAGIVTRVAGADRFAVAESLARRGWDPAGDKSWPGVTDVIVANGENGKEADPLAAAGLAGAYNAPVLLIKTTSLTKQTTRALTEIAASNPGLRVHVIGGKVTVPVARWNEIKAIPGVSAVDYRVEGRDRYDVTAKIAQRMVSKLGSGGVNGALIINVENPKAFYDALAASPQAYSGNWAMLGVRAGSVPAPVASVLSGALAGKPRHVVNATSYVNAAVYTSVGAQDRYSDTTDVHTSASRIAEKVAANSPSTAREVGVASMLPDALTGGVFLGRREGLLLFTDASTTLRPVTASFLTANANGMSQGWVFGGERSVPLAQETEFAGIID